MIPDYQTIMLPLLKLLVDQQEHSLQDTIEHIVKLFQVSPEERRELLPSGKQSVIDNRVGWARTYLKKAGLLEYTRRGYYRITQRGVEILNRDLDSITVAVLKEFPEFKLFQNLKKPRQVSAGHTEEESNLTPKEIISNTVETLLNELADDLLEQLKSASPGMFEHIVVDLLVKMGYGGSDKDAARAIGRSGDEGVDGVINQDTLGIDRIYVQAKRWNEKSVGHRDIRDFIGALDFKHAERGIFITTSSFVKGIKQDIDRSSKRIILIDGNELARLMIENNVGVSVEDTYELKKLDMDYFIEE